MLAPTGTIGFMMDCDTTGIEPDIALIKYKRLVGGGMIKIVNNTIPRRWPQLGYDDDAGKAIVEYIDTEETIEGAPGLKPEHLPVFDCAFRAANGTRSIHYHGPHPDDGGRAAVHLGRHLQDGQPAARGHGRGRAGGLHGVVEAGPEGGRHLPRRLQAHAAALDQQDRPRAGQGRRPVGGGSEAGQERAAGGRAAQAARRAPVVHAQVLAWPVTKATSTSGSTRPASRARSSSGWPRRARRSRASWTASPRRSRWRCSTAFRCGSCATSSRAPASSLTGFTENPEIPRASSIMDYIFRWLAAKFVRETPVAEAEPAPAASAELQRVGDVVAAAQKVEVIDVSAKNGHNGHANGNGSTHTGNGNYSFIARTDAPTCPECGSIMIPNGSCHKCVNCGTTSGCS